MVVFRGEEVAHHLDLDFIAASVLMADVMALLVDGTDILQLS